MGNKITVAKMFIFFVILATLATQLSNFVAIKYFSESAPWASALKAAIITLPLAFLATIFFNVYYGSGSTTINYTTLNAIGIGSAFFIGFGVQAITGSKGWNFYEVSGNILIVAGVSLVLLKKTTGV